MDIHVTLRHGPLEVDIDADSEDDYQSELLDLLEFLEEYEERFTDLKHRPETGAEEDSDETSGQSSIDAFAGGNGTDGGDDTTSTTGGIEETSDDDPAASLARKLKVSAGALHDIVDIDPSGEEPPFLLVDADQFGDAKRRRQFTTSLLILAVWEECYEADRMKSSLLMDALEYSGVDSANMFEMYNLDDADAFFDKTGRGGSTTLKLRRPGIREAHKKFRELLE